MCYEATKSTSWQIDYNVKSTNRVDPHLAPAEGVGSEVAEAVV